MTIVARKRFFVYTLARPDGRVFYVGKGTGKRPYNHITEARKGCYCPKCKIIHEILRVNKEPIISYVFETDDEREAYAQEVRQIEALSRVYRLTNKTGRGWVIPDPPRPPVQMDLVEMKAYLNWIDATPKECASRLQEWARARAEWAKRNAIKARLDRRFDDVEHFKACEQEANTILYGHGGAYQFSLNLE